MSRYENPYDGGAEGAERYVRAMLERLGDRDPLEVLAAGPDSLERRLAGAGGEELRARVTSDTWSVAEVTLHLADAEIVYAQRYRAVIAQENPPTPGFDQERWVAARAGALPAAAESLALFSGIRRGNVFLLAHLEPPAWERTGRHERRGAETLRRIVQLAAAHDLVHLDQIDRTLRALRTPD